MSPRGRSTCLSLAIIASLGWCASAAPADASASSWGGGKEGPSPCTVRATLLLDYKLSCPLEVIPFRIEIEARCPLESSGSQRVPDLLELSLPLPGELQLYDAQFNRLQPASDSQSPVPAWTFRLAADGEPALVKRIQGYLRPLVPGDVDLGQGGSVILSDNAGGRAINSVEPVFLGVSPRCPSISRRTIYLPSVRNEGCGLTRQPADLVFVLDQSESAGDGNLPLAGGVARGLVDTIDLKQDRVAVVAFDKRARLVVPLTSDRHALNLGLQSLKIAPGSRIDVALLAAVGELTGPRSLAGRKPIIILISDGVDSRTGSRNAVLAAAKVATDQQIGIMTLAIGKAPDFGLLNAISSDPKLTLSGTTPDELSRAYRAMADVSQCVR